MTLLTLAIPVEMSVLIPTMINKRILMSPFFSSLPEANIEVSRPLNMKNDSTAAVMAITII